MTEFVERFIELALIDRPDRPHRLTIDIDELNRLADDIAANGLHQAVAVKPKGVGGRYATIYGDRRVIAYRMLNRETIRARIYPADADELQIRMAENEMRADLTPVEQAHICAEFVDRAEPLVAIARHFRRSPAWVSSRLALLELPEDLQAALAERVITVSVAQALARVDHDVYRRQLIAEAGNHGCTERTAAAWAAHYLADRERLISNTMTVEQLRARREDFRLMCQCQVCQGEVDLVDTSALRVCRACLAQLADALAEHGPANRHGEGP